MVSSMLSFSPFIFNHHVQAHPFIVLSTSENQVSFLPDWKQLGVDCSSLLLQPIHTPTGLFLAFIEFSKLNSMFRICSRTIWRLCWVSTIRALLSHRILHFLKGSNRSELIMFLKKDESLFSIKLRWRQIVSRQSRSSFLQEGVENLRIGAPPRL